MSTPSKTLCAVALLASVGAVTQAQATVVTFNTPIAIPNTFNGVYVNLANGVNSPTTAGAPGWDFGPWGSSNTLTFFWPATAATNGGGVGTATSYTDLTVGSVISSSSTFLASAQSTATTSFQTSGNHILGFRFLNESTSAINYGYANITTTGPLGFPATITSWSFENSGGSITVTAVPEASTAAMLSMGALVLGALNLRRKRKLAA